MKPLSFFQFSSSTLLEEGESVQFSVYVVLLHYLESLVTLACRLSLMAIMNEPLGMPWTLETFTGADLEKYVDRFLKRVEGPDPGACYPGKCLGF